MSDDTFNEMADEIVALRQEVESLRADVEDCAVKHCDQPATLGMTIIEAGLRVELYLCETHFDALATQDTPND